MGLGPGDPRPDFILGGASRSGTTYLCHVLAGHTSVYLPRPFIPEPKVLVGPPERDEVYRERYARLFGGAPVGARRLEKTTYYLEFPVCGERIHRLLPDVRLFFLLREPVERAYSNYLWSRKNGLETLPFEEAVERPDRPSPLPPEKAYARPFAYIDRGDYARFAEFYFGRFGRDRVVFFLFEEMIRRPAVFFARLASFLGLDTIAFDRGDPGTVNSAKEAGPPLSEETRARLRARMRPLVERFAGVSGMDLSDWGYDL